MKKLLCFFLVFSKLCGDTVTPEIIKRCDPEIVNFGYNKFVPSPYSGTIVVTPFDSSQGMAIFAESLYKTAFFKLAPHYAPQQKITTCGIASGVIILNTIYADNGITPPISYRGSFYDKCANTVYGDFIWTEDNYFTPKVRRVLDRDLIEGRKKINGDFLLGLNIHQLAKSLRLHDLDVTIHHAKEVTPQAIDHFRDVVKSVTSNPTQYMIANYSLSLYLEDGGGHFSPIAAYDQVTDTVLILDTWAATNVWVWAELEDFYKSMHTKDGDQYRGYLLVSK